MPPLMADKVVIEVAAVVVSDGREITLRVSVHVWPPMFNAKLAVPMADAVPVMV